MIIKILYETDNVHSVQSLNLIGVFLHWNIEELIAKLKNHIIDNPEIPPLSKDDIMNLKSIYQTQNREINYIIKFINPDTILK